METHRPQDAGRSDCLMCRVVPIAGLAFLMLVLLVAGAILALCPCGNGAAAPAVLQSGSPPPPPAPVVLQFPWAWAAALAVGIAIGALIWVIVILVAVLLMSGRSVRFAPGQFRSALKLLLSMFKGLPNLERALRDAAAAHAVAGTVAGAVAKKLRESADGVGATANALGAIEFPSMRFRVDPIGPGSPLHYVRLDTAASIKPLDGAKTLLNGGKDKVHDAGDKVDDLAKAFAAARDALNLAADAVRMLSP